MFRPAPSATPVCSISSASHPDTLCTRWPATVAIADYPRPAFLPIPLAFLVARSRMVLELHYPSDVLARATTGAAIAGISLVL